MKVIQQELGEETTATDEIDEYRQKIAKAQLPDEVAEKLLKEVEQLEKQPFGSAEGHRDPQLSGHLPGAAVETKTPGSG